MEGWLQHRLTLNTKKSDKNKMQQGQLKNHFLVSQNVKIVNISVHILWFYTLENVLSDLKHPIKA